MAISNRRILSLENGQVSFEWKAYRDGGKSKVQTVSADEFIRRFLQRALPPGFQHIRYFGFLAHCHRERKLELCRQLIATAVSLLLPSPQACQQYAQSLTVGELRRCPQCGIGILAYLHLPPPSTIDSS